MGGAAVQAHRSAVGTLWIAHNGDIEVAVIGGSSARGGSVMVAPNLTHMVTLNAPEAECFFCAPLLADARRFAAAMTPAGAGLWTTQTSCPSRGGSSSEQPVAPDASASPIVDAAPFDERDVDPRVLAIIAALRAKPWRAHRAPDLARLVDLSESRFRHILKAETGLTLKRLRVWLRLEWALIAAQRGSNLTAAAHDAGFSSSAHFSSACRDGLGLTPSQIVEALRPATAHSLRRPGHFSAAAASVMTQDCSSSNHATGEDWHDAYDEAC